MSSRSIYASMAGWTGWPASWDRRAQAISRADAVKLIATCGQRVRVMKASLGNLARTKGEHSARRLQRRFLLSWSARVHALARAYRRKFGRLEDAPDSDISDLLELAPTNSPWLPSREKAFAIPKEKRMSGEHRWVHIHGVLLYANELIARDASEPLTPLLPTQFLSNGGEPKLREWLSENLAQTKLVITVDIPSCFDKISRSSVEDNLVLPKKVVREVLFRPTDNAIFLQPSPKQFKEGDGPIAKVNSGKRGVAQGSALATLASEAVIGDVLREVADVSPAILVGSHSDNLIVLLKDASLAGSVIKNLTLAVGKHFGAGVLPEFTCRITVSKVADGFQFCRRNFEVADGKLRVRVPDKNIDEFALKTMIAIGDASYSKSVERLIHLQRSIKGWMRTAPYSNRVLDEGAELLAQLRSIWPKIVLENTC